MERTLSHWAIPPLGDRLFLKIYLRGNVPTRKWANNMCLYTRHDVIHYDNLYIYIGVCVCVVDVT